MSTLPHPDAPSPVLASTGRCLATDKVVVDRQPVRFMYREAPMFADDSGWRFLAGNESDEYMENPKHQRAHDLAVVASHDPSIVPHLGAAVGAAFQKPVAGGPFEAAGDWEADED